MAEADNTESIIPANGDRGIVIGATGSGKSTASMWLLRRIPRVPTVIYNTKDEKMFAELPNVARADYFDDVLKLVDDGQTDYVDFHPPSKELNRPEILDGYLWRHLHELQDIPAYIDELYSFHRRGDPFDGLTALLTRGRGAGITTIMATQRPAYISMFSLTEAQHFYIFRLSHKHDHKRVSNVVDGYDTVKKPGEFGFHYYNIRDRQLREFAPIRPDKKPLAPKPGSEDNAAQLMGGPGAGLTWI